MSANQFGHFFKVSTFGESHGSAMGAVIDGCPAGLKFDEDLLVANLKRRRPGQSEVTSERKELDEPQVLSGVFQGKTLGTPISLVIWNKDQRSQDYDLKQMEMRKGHATDLWQGKFGHSDPRGSGRASGRETVSRVLGGSVAQMLLRQMCPEMKVFAFVSQVGPHFLKKDHISELAKAIDASEIQVDDFITRIPQVDLDSEVSKILKEFKSSGDSYGGYVDLFITCPPRYLGQPVFKKLKSELASAMMSIGTSQSLEIGLLNSLDLSGSEFHKKSASYSGLRGGISTGERIHLRIGFKPPSTVGEMAKQGRHDPCILPRVVPVVEAMAHLVLADQVLWSTQDKLSF